MAHGRNFDSPSDRLYSDNILHPEQDWNFRARAKVGEWAFRHILKAEPYSPLYPTKWNLPTQSEEPVVIDINDERFFAALPQSDLGMFYGYVGPNNDQLWAPDSVRTSIPHDVDTGNPAADSLVPTLEAFSQASRAIRRLGRKGAQLVAPLRDRHALQTWIESTARTKAEIDTHYNIYPEVYDAMLDRRFVQYSSGLLAPESEFTSLEDLQEQKINSIIDKLRLKPGMSLLEIGGGWGGLAVAIAERVPDVEITSLTVAHEQYIRAVARAEEAGVDERVHFEERDYRDLDPSQTFDRIVSIEMIEAVAWQDDSTYFDAVTTHPKEDGIVVLQAITIPNSNFASQRHNKNFANVAIFPGGVLRPKEVIDQQMSKRGWRLVDATQQGSSYALTLREWIRNLHSHKGELVAEWQSQGITQNDIDQFWRGFAEFYLAASEAGFRPGTGPNIDTWQLAYSKN